MHVGYKVCRPVASVLTTASWILDMASDAPAVAGAALRASIGSGKENTRRDGNHGGRWRNAELKEAAQAAG